MREEPRRVAAVTGDVTVDWMFLQQRAEGANLDFAWQWGGAVTSGMEAHPGGAAFAGALVEQAVAASPDLREGLTVAAAKLPARALSTPLFKGVTKTFSVWSPFPAHRGSKELVWRMASYLGEEASSGPVSQRTGGQPSRSPCDPLPSLDAAPDCLLIHDLNLGVRQERGCWSRLLRPQTASQTVVLSTLPPFASGPLWEELVAGSAKDLTVVVTSEDLRKEGIQLGYPLSWEQMHGNVVEGVLGHGLSRAARVVVVLGAAGAVVVERDGSSILVFDSRHQEGEWAGDYEGVFWGFVLLACVSAALLMEFASSTAPDLSAAVTRGLEATRSMHVEGYWSGTDRRAHWASFVGRPAAVLTSKPASGVQAEHSDFGSVRLPTPPHPGHSLLLASGQARDLMSLAREAARTGPERLPAGIPIETVGDWVSVDRSEIESLRAVRNIVKEYIQQWRRGGRLRVPLSIGVFGPPGAGKSFAVGEMGRVLLGGQLRKLTFNLSQFRSEEELPAAFHQIRDLALQQHLPFVFWDEFDADLAGIHLGWLRSFLAPMQDGEFRDSGGAHPIGTAVFVFAGGTCDSFQRFAQGADPATDRAAKKRDFLSRLRGYLNIFGPNRLSDSDILYPLRRAFLLHSVLMRKAAHIARDGRLDIDDAVLHAFLGVPEFLHGARSVEAIVDMCALAGKARLSRSALPPADQLALHVDAEAFLALLAFQWHRARPPESDAP